MTMLMDNLDFKNLPLYEKRSFLPEKIDLTDRQTTVMLYEKLFVREVNSEEELKQWLFDRSELDAALDQQGSILYIRMTCQMDNKNYFEAYKKFIEEVVPAIKPYSDKLNRKHLALRKRFPFEREEFKIYDQKIKMDIELFIEKNIPLQTKLQLLSQEYQAICGAMTVSFKGEEKTLVQMAKFLLEPDRSLRESAWRASSQRRIQDKDKLDRLFDEMLSLRHQMAVNAGCVNFCEYQFRAFHRFDYTSSDCKQFHTVVEKLVVPLWEAILKKRQEALKVDNLRPWDLSVDPLGRAALKPFDHVEELVNGTLKAFKMMDENFYEQFKELVDLGLLDLDNRKGKAPGGYQTALSEARKPFIFMNAVGTDNDVRTFLHEAGHAFHSLACAHHFLFDYRHGPMEFNEVASMGMELLASEYLSIFYNKEDKERSLKTHFEDIIYTLVWVATVDAFQHWIYENPAHSHDERKQAWLKIYERFGGKFIHWQGLEEIESYLWHKQLHIFEVPFYYIEYGIAQLGALQLWLNAKKNFPLALSKYREALSLGGSRPLPELFQTAGLKFGFSYDTLQPLMVAVKQQLENIK